MKNQNKTSSSVPSLPPAQQPSYPNYFEIPPSTLHIDATIEETLVARDIHDRRLWFNIGVCSKSNTEAIDSATLLVTDIVHHIIQYNREDVGIPIEKRKPIKLYIDSPGGEKYEGFGLVDAIRLSKTPVYTYNVAECASMGFLIFIAGHKRITFPRAVFLHHDGQYGDYDSSSKFMDSAEFGKRYEGEVVRKFVLEQTKITAEVYDKHLRVEWWMLPKDAIELGIAHKIAESMDDII